MALQRDSTHAKHQMVDEALIRSMADNQMASLENLILAQRAAQLKMAQYLRDAEARHAKAVQELEEEKAKHAHDTAQGDDVTYALEKERTRLKQELETERQAKR
ncbi:CTTNBP2 N-terminal-like protein, partial [Amphibalanus amphitrite]|uniref:CTTNBP2 N-terminal-like protein n=1 Tax=Amphibalanus amphitrite TaxID=1232801 RepID=UPI001C8FFDDA